MVKYTSHFAKQYSSQWSGQWISWCPDYLIIHDSSSQLTLANVHNYSKILGIALGDVAQIVLLVRLLKDMQNSWSHRAPVCENGELHIHTWKKGASILFAWSWSFRMYITWLTWLFIRNMNFNFAYQLVHLDLEIRRPINLRPPDTSGLGLPVVSPLPLFWPW